MALQPNVAVLTQGEGVNDADVTYPEAAKLLSAGAWLANDLAGRRPGGEATCALPRPLGENWLLAALGPEY